MKRIFICLMCALALVSCGTGTKEYTDWLYESMSLADSLTHSREWYAANVEKTLETRRKMGWGVPEREFRHFVLPMRVNNEYLDDFRLIYSDSLCARVAGMTMADAALEINHWCHEMATYRPSDGRTSSPLQTIGRGVGRCGEESVLAVAALRAAGIPARQVYTPRWAHTDDNHAWVEAWVDGAWHFMGACEPEPVLDLGWFNSSVSRAMILHTRVTGDYKGPEDVISSNVNYTEINVVRGYVDARRSVVKVVDAEGKPVEGARVEFKIYNYAEFYTVASYLTDSNGCTGLDMGLGDMLAWACKDGIYGFAKVDSDSVTLRLDHRLGERASFDFDIVPPAEKALPSLATEEQTAANAARLKEEDEIRNARVAATRYTEIPAVVKQYLSEKDLTDVTPEVVQDALFRLSDKDHPEFRNGERIEIEQLLPYRKAIYEAMSGTVTSPLEVAAWIRSNIRVDDSRSAMGLRIPPAAVLEGRSADSRSRDIFFVAACRSLGFASRLEDGTAKPQYYEDGSWKYVDFEGATELEHKKGFLALDCDEGVAYYRQFTISRIEDGRTKLLDFDEDSDVAAENLKGNAPLDEGDYMLVSGLRLADGSVLAHIDMFGIREGCITEQKVHVRESGDKLAVIGSIDVEQSFVPDGAAAPMSIISVTGRTWYVLAYLGSRTEPATHILRQLSEISSELEQWGGKVLIVRKADAKADDWNIPGAVRGTDHDGKIAALNGISPYLVLADSFGRVVYLSEGYDTSMGTHLSLILQRFFQKSC
ncbi:MAG: transglutaminase domain-containing protein [Bacteroidales bacterium]|nr:transglutaminase domain-containing protein [Candidatus Cryptobacteroides equifaecalis]